MTGQDARSAAHTAPRLESAHPEYRSESAERLGREGMVTVWDDLGRYVGCMGVELWRHLLTVESDSERLREALNEIADVSDYRADDPLYTRDVARKALRG